MLHFQEGMLHARTTNFQRTILTLAGVMTGLISGDTAGKTIPVVGHEVLEEWACRVTVRARTSGDSSGVMHPYPALSLWHQIANWRLAIQTS